MRYFGSGRGVAGAQTWSSMRPAAYSIEIRTGPSWRSSDSRIVLSSQAICYGPVVSWELQVAYKQAYPGREPISADEFYSRLSTIGTAEQRAVSGFAKMIVTATGAAAEARLGGSPWDKVFPIDACLADRMGSIARRDCRGSR